MRNLFSIIALALLLLSCKSDRPKNPVQPLYDEVMAIHDDVMPKMTDIHRLKKEIRKTYQDTSADKYKKSLQVLSQLEAADEGMMEWMADFSMPEGESTEAKKTYLLKEKKAISQVRDDMLAAIAEGKKLVQ